MDKISLERLAEFVSGDIQYSVRCFEGGFWPVYFEKEEVLHLINTLKCGLTKEITIQDLARLKVTIVELKRMYQDVESLKEYTLNTEFIKCYFSERSEHLPLTVDEYIDLCFRERDLFKMVTKRDLINMLGGLDFYNKAQGLDNILIDLIQQEQRNQKQTRSNKKSTISGIVYLLKIKDQQHYKIGVSTQFKDRYNSLSTQMPFELITINKIKSNDIYGLEEKLHQKFADKRVNGEWFELSKKDVDYIKSIEDDIYA